MKLLICENLKNVEIDLKNRLTNMGFDVVYLVESPAKAIEVLNGKRADAVIMDSFPDEEISGLEAAKTITAKFDIPVIFVVADVSDDNVSDYILTDSPVLVKPVKDIELKVNINLAAKLYSLKRQNRHPALASPDEEFIFVRADYKLNKIKVPDIYYIEAKKDYINIHTSENVYTVHSTMRDIMKVLPQNTFIRIHRSYIVNIHKIFSIKYPDLLIEKKMKILPVGGLYRKELFNSLKII